VTAEQMEDLIADGSPHRRRSRPAPRAADESTRDRAANARADLGPAHNPHWWSLQLPATRHMRDLRAPDSGTRSLVVRIRSRDEQLVIVVYLSEDPAEHLSIARATGAVLRSGSRSSHLPGLDSGCGASSHSMQAAACALGVPLHPARHERERLEQLSQRRRRSKLAGRPVHQ
jgi:hypothetical protein